jgi:hypothetical protein
MSRIRASLIFRPFSQPRFTPRTTTPIAFSQQKRYAGQDYGSGQGDPKGEDPQNQGSNPSADLEHPGPPPPAEGQGTGGGPTKAHSGGHNTQQNDSSSAGSNGSASGSGAQPKIHNSKVPSEESDDVKQHNEDMGKRHDSSHKQSNDDGKVAKGFWSGEQRPMTTSCSGLQRTDKFIRARRC